jgi:hypothetical protein
LAGQRESVPRETNVKTSRPPPTDALRPSWMCSVSPSDALRAGAPASGDAALDPGAAAGGVEHAAAMATPAQRIPDLVVVVRCTVFLDGSPRPSTLATCC